MENGTNANLTLIKTNTYTGATYQQWKLVRNWNGTYQFLTKLGGSTKGIAVQDASLDTKAKCVLYTQSVDFMYNDDWTIEPVNLGKAYFYGFSNTDNSNNGVNTKADCEVGKTLADTMGFADTSTKIDNSAADALGTMPLVNLWYFRGHGVVPGSGLAFRNYNNGTWKTTYLYGKANSSTNRAIIATLNANALRNLYLLGTNSCLTGNAVEKDGDYNDFVGMAYRKGAHFVFATTMNSFTDQNSPWMQYFMGKIAEGKSFYEAIQEADSYVMTNAIDSNDSLVIFRAMRACSRHYAGDVEIVLKH